MRLPRLPIPAAPARHETVASYLTRLAALHGLHPRELWEPISSPRTGTNRRHVHADRLAAITARPVEQLTRALPELRDLAPDWAAWRYQPQPRCPRCDARHDGGPVRSLPQHRYVCGRHRYWIGPPDAGQTATALGSERRDVLSAQRRHVRLVRRRGSAAAFDAVLTGFMICGHLWADPSHRWATLENRWTRRAIWLIPPGMETSDFSASRLFAAVYPEAVDIDAVIASPLWRRLASGDVAQRRSFVTMIGKILAHPDYEPPTRGGDAIVHWMKYDSHRPPSRPHTTFPETREFGSTRPASTPAHSQQRQWRSGQWFAVNRRGGGIILHHRHIRPVLIREWSRPMDGLEASIHESQNTFDPRDPRPWLPPPEATSTTARNPVRSDQDDPPRLNWPVQPNRAVLPIIGACRNT